MKPKRTQKDIAVETALYEKAVGKTVIQQESYKCKHIEYSTDGKKVREYETVEVRDVHKLQAAEMAAISMWLKCRQPHLWAEGQGETPTAVQIVDNIPVKVEADSSAVQTMLDTPLVTHTQTQETKKVNNLAKINSTQNTTPESATVYDQ